jgi:hypothetical protein
LISVMMGAIAIAILFGGDSNTVDLMLPGTCSFLPYP